MGGALFGNRIHFRAVVLLALAAGGSVWAAPADARVPPLRDPVLLNIGFVCRWQDSCMKKQQRAMRRALSYVKVQKPPAWKVQQCNRNASRRRERVDWIGFNNCIRNRSLGRAPVGRR